MLFSEDAHPNGFLSHSVIWIAELTQAFKNSPALQAANDVSEPHQCHFATCKEELAEHLAHSTHPQLDALIARLQQNDPATADKILQAIILLRIKAGDKKRKSSHFPSYHHSLRIAESVLKIVDGVITDDAHLSQLAIKSILHDLVEDFDKKKGERHIRAIFDNAIADGVMGMSMPDRAELVKSYYFIVSQYVSPEDIAEGPDSYFNKLKEQSPDNYLILKAELKLHFKIDRAEMFAANDQFDELLIKAVDNPDTFASDILDIADGALKIYASEYLNAQPPQIEANVFYLSSARARRNISDRIKYHEAAMRQISKLIDKTTCGDTADKMRIVQDRLNQNFYATVSTFEALLDATVGAPNRISPGVRQRESFVSALKQGPVKLGHG